jgi:hypothetical protein
LSRSCGRRGGTWWRLVWDCCLRMLLGLGQSGRAQSRSRRPLRKKVAATRADAAGARRTAGRGSGPFKMAQLTHPPEGFRCRGLVRATHRAPAAAGNSINSISNPCHATGPPRFLDLGRAC